LFAVLDFLVMGSLLLLPFLEEEVDDVGAAVASMCDEVIKGDIDQIHLEETLRRFYMQSGYLLYNLLPFLEEEVDDVGAAVARVTGEDGRHELRNGREAPRPTFTSRSCVCAMRSSKAISIRFTWKRPCVASTCPWGEHRVGLVRELTPPAP
jgi:hypothetical protein